MAQTWTYRRTCGRALNGYQASDFALAESVSLPSRPSCMGWGRRFAHSAHRDQNRRSVPSDAICLPGSSRFCRLPMPYIGHLLDTKAIFDPAETATYLFLLVTPRGFEPLLPP